MKRETEILRLILGDQLNYHHSWFSEVRPEATYVLMEIRSETDYVQHHIQKVAGFFAAGLSQKIYRFLRMSAIRNIFLQRERPFPNSSRARKPT